VPVDAVEVYQRLKPKLGQEETKLLVRFVEKTVTIGVATKQDLRSVEAGLKELIHNLEMELLNVGSELKADTQVDRPVLACRPGTVKTAIDHAFLGRQGLFKKFYAA